MTAKQLSILITRPKADGLKLQHMLQADGIAALCQPLIDIKPGRQLTQLSQQLNQADIVIAVSKHAVLHAAHQLGQQWPKAARYIAVGHATQKVWQQQLSANITAPAEHSSEGLLALPQLEHVAGKRIVILRGQSGRELLAQQLCQRGATVSYCECYQRQLITLNSSQLVPYWQQQNIAFLVVTSGEQLSHLISLCQNDYLPWLYSTWLITVSERIAAQARNAGFSKISISDGASNAALKTTLLDVLHKAKAS